MINNHHKALIANAITTTLFTLSTQYAFADSAKVFFPSNGHYYQRFDIADINWYTAKSNCEALKAHLVTVAGPNNGSTQKTPENTFVYSQLASKSPAGSDAYYFTGAYYSSSTVSWNWVTDEPWGYTGSQPPTSNYTYFAMYTGSDYWYWKPVKPNGLSNSHTSGYICEWDVNNYVDSATIPDINGNGADETAVLYMSNQTGNPYIVVIRDQNTNALISTLTFSSINNMPPIGLAVVADMNVNGTPEIAVLSASGNIRIKDAKNNAVQLASINFFNSTYQIRSLNSTYSSNITGFSELTVVGIAPNNTVTAQTRDSKSGALLFNRNF